MFFAFCMLKVHWNLSIIGFSPTCFCSSTNSSVVKRVVSVLLMEVEKCCVPLHRSVSQYGRVSNLDVFPDQQKGRQPPKKMASQSERDKVTGRWPHRKSTAKEEDTTKWQGMKALQEDEIKLHFEFFGFLHFKYINVWPLLHYGWKLNKFTLVTHGV